MEFHILDVVLFVAYLCVTLFVSCRSAFGGNKNDNLTAERKEDPHDEFSEETDYLVPQKDGNKNSKRVCSHNSIVSFNF